MDFLWILVLFLVGSQQAYCDYYPGHEQEDEFVTLTTECTAESCEPHLHEMDRLHEEYFSPIEADSREKRTRYVFPQSRELINTSFTCEGKPHIPGFYADMEANCQIFHACYTDVTEHYLCPVGTIFDQKNLVCNSLEKVQCQMTPMHYHSNSLLSLADKKREPKDFFFRSIFDVADAFDHDTTDPTYTTDGESVEVSLLKIYLLAKVLEASDIIEMMEESSPDSSDRKGRQLKDSTSPDVIEDILKKAVEVVFPLLPVRFNVTPSDSRRQFPRLTELFPRRTTERLSRKERILQILHLVFSSIKETAGILSGVSRGILVSNYFNFLLDSIKSD